MTKALIIDDEKHCCDHLQWLLENYCPNIQVLATADHADQGSQLIRRLKPQLIFLDVEMPDKNGFEMLSTLPEIDFDIIFTTAHEKYAIRAIRLGAMDYLVKPIDKDDLCQAIDKRRNQHHNDTEKQLNALLTHLRQQNDWTGQKAAFPTQSGYQLVMLKDIMVCEGSSNYTNVHLQSGQHLLVSKTLKEIAAMLDFPPFFRLHHSFLVNLQFVERYIKGEGGFITLQNGMTIPVSRNKKEQLLTIITHLSP